jgi:hypothetical protein
MRKNLAAIYLSTPLIVGLVFIVLKLFHIISWTWWIVTIPFWGTFLLVLIVFAIIGFALLFGPEW